jgi:hypothetical protein
VLASTQASLNQVNWCVKKRCLFTKELSVLELLPALIGTIIRLLPIAIVYMIGLSIAFARKQRYPKASLYALFGFGALLTSVVLAVPTQMIILYRPSKETLGITILIVSLVLGALQVIGSALVVLAVFADRE